MLKLYLDCDGVILDTITRSYAVLKEMKIESEEEITRFYTNLDWDDLILSSGEIAGATNKIKKLTEKFDVEILTHVTSENEIISKKKYFAEKLPGINIIFVPKPIKKTDVVEAKGAILVDDYSLNLDDWLLKGGIPVKFSDSGKKSTYITITDLLDLLTIDFANIAKEKIRVKL